MTFSDPLIGSQLAGFRIESLLGHGGMASVYYGVDLHLQRPVAIKVIAQRFRGDQAYADRFVREARAMAAWRHPNIPQVYQAGVDQDISYYAMEYIAGLDLGRVLQEYHRMGELPPYTDVLFIGRSIANALDYAHSRGVIHRDVKPSNILISTNDEVYLTDFGLVLDLSRGTQGEVFGTPQYISPEQARSSAAAVPQSDLYSLGVILYEMLTGSLPFDDPSPASLALMHITHQPPPPRQINPSLSPQVEAVLLRALSKAPAGRYATGRKLIDALERGLLSGDTSPGTISLGPTKPVTVSEAAPPETIWPPRTLSRLHAAEIVSRSAEAQPPQTIAPGAAVHPTSASTADHPVASAARKSLSPQRIGLGCGAILMIALLLLLGNSILSWGRGRDNQNNATGIVAGNLPAATSQPTGLAQLPASPSPRVAATTSLPLVIPTRSPAPSKTPTPDPTYTPAPTFTPSIWHSKLLLFKLKDESLVLRFEGPGELPLGPLQLAEDKKARVVGKNWEVDRLKPGECVVVWRKEGNPDLPQELKCEYTGKPVERDNKNRFWTKTFSILYSGETIGACRGEETYCVINLDIPTGPRD